ncbi:hypothetical protein CYLTODRAFT_368666 [Cylindrobasidium torrendii FP15055 ss-10]|uniref:Uncharacterized protein n=1 Tax=Cylindrobasidium torrendii FP15055 ss-10 TaxID=1314674 RepID=A0A0D7BMW0_9AGAR|nr:hypothetical protein CYLTODRAFT_368666 [Cylindrobasidium torrendii FP15055 ss-10]
MDQSLDIPLLDWVSQHWHFLALGLVVLVRLALVYGRSLQSQDRGLDPKTTAPHAFTYPSLSRCPVDVKDIAPRAYRPFKPHYHVTLSLRPMVWEDWIEVDRDFDKYYAIREFRVKTKAKDLILLEPDSSPRVGSAYSGVIELLHEMVHFLHARHPDMFAVTLNEKLGYAEYIQLNLPHQPRYALPPPLVVEGKLRTVTEDEARKALEVIALISQDDWALLVEGADERYYVQGGAILVPGSWRLKDKIGMALDDLHNEARVPQYKEKLEVGMSRFFKRIPVDKPATRNNYGFQVTRPSSSARDDVDPEDLAWATLHHGDEDSFGDGERHKTPARPLVSPETLRLRSERQSVRRLPLTGVVAFGIRTYLYNVEDLADEAGVAKRLASAVRSWTQDVHDYKGARLYSAELLKYLDSVVAEKGDEVGDEKPYPF